MRKIYNEYFHIPEKGIVREKVFFARIAVSVVCIILCMAALGFNAYAFFTSDVTSKMNVIQSAGYDLAVVAKDSNENEIQAQTPVVPIAEQETNKTPLNAKIYTLQKGTYTFAMTKVEGSSSTGYAKITLSVANKDAINPFFSLPIGGVYEGEGEAKKEIITRNITIVVMQETTVTVVPCWGSYSGTDAITELEMIYCDTSTNKVVKIATAEYSEKLAAEAAAATEAIKKQLTQTSEKTSTENTSSEQKKEETIAPTNTESNDSKQDVSNTTK